MQQSCILVVGFCTFSSQALQTRNILVPNAHILEGFSFKWKLATSEMFSNKTNLLG